MVIKKILILGSTYLTELVINKIKHNYDLVGYVPSIKPTKKGCIDLPLGKMSTYCDIKLSIQYDRIVKEIENYIIFAHSLITGVENLKRKDG